MLSLVAGVPCETPATRVPEILSANAPQENLPGRELDDSQRQA
jgi:hypothetical protein